MTQYLCEVNKKYLIPRKIFVPEPKVCRMYSGRVAGGKGNGNEVAAGLFHHESQTGTRKM